MKISTYIFSCLFHCSTIKNMWILSVFSFCWDKIPSHIQKKIKIKLLLVLLRENWRDGEEEAKSFQVLLITIIIMTSFSEKIIQFGGAIRVLESNCNSSNSKLSLLINREVVSGDYRVKIATYFSTQCVCVYVCMCACSLMLSPTVYVWNNIVMRILNINIAVLDVTGL